MNLSMDPLRPYAELARWVAVAVLAVVLIALGYRWGASHWKGQYTAEVQARAAENAQHAATLQALADATAAVAEKAKAASVALAQSRRENDTRYEKAQDDAKRAQRDLAAALRRGDVQLHPQWTCAAARPLSGGVAPDAVQASAAGRANSAARIVGAADADAAVIAAGCAVEAQP